MSSSPQQKNIIVTGASRGLGKEIALAFGRSGARVIVHFVSRKQEAEAVAEAIVRAGGEAIPFKADVRLAREVERMVDYAVKNWGVLHVFVNNAGVNKDGLLLRMSEQDWDSVLDTNLKGAFHGIRAASEIMCKQHDGHIINIASIAGLQGREGQANYSSSKAALIGLTKAAAKELGPFAVKINAVLPGFLLTDMGDTVSEDIRRRILKENALGKASDPLEVANFICHLSQMNNVSGQIFNLDSRII